MQTNAVQFVLYLFLGPETRYVKGQEPKASHESAGFRDLFRFRRIDPTPLTILDFVRPLGLAVRPCVMIPAAAYSMVFLLAGVLITIEIPQIYPEEFHFNTQQVGLQNVSIIIGTYQGSQMKSARTISNSYSPLGSLLGEQIGGYMSDWWMVQGRKRTESSRAEFRLWLSYLGYSLAIGGVIMFLICTHNAGEHWNVTPLIGAAIAAGGNQIVTTVLVTYAIDCYPQQAAAIGTFITFVRQTWGFIGPFW